MKIHKIADIWYQLAPTITLYHGTTESNLQSILQDGFQPFDAKDKIQEIVERHGYSMDDIPPWVWHGEFRLRSDKPYIYFTNKKDQAKSYSQKPFGEFETAIVEALNRYLKEKGEPQVAIPEYKPVVITVDAPWDEFKSYKDYEGYKRIVDNATKWKDREQSPEDFLSELFFEFWVDRPLSKEYIVNWEYVTSGMKHW